MTLLSNRLALIQPSATLAMSAKASQMREAGIDVISLSVGEPDFDTPRSIQLAAVRAMESGMTKYTPVDGVTPLKKAIQAKFLRDSGISYDLNEIMASTGGKQVIFNALMASLNPGDEVIIPAPYWVSYPDITNLFGGIPKIIACDEKNNFKLLPEQLEVAITPQTKWLILNTPSNPTGEIYTRDELKALSDVLLRHPDVHVMCDDIYEYLVYDGLKTQTLLTVCPELKERCLIVNGVSKSYSMTGWRLGYGAGPKALIKAMVMLQSQSTTNPSSISQAAAIQALNGDQTFLDEWRESFAQRRDLVWGLINDIPGLSCRKPGGAFYLYVNCSAYIGKKTPEGAVIADDAQFATYLLEKGRVATVNGDAFGLSPYFRISYVITNELLIEACARIKQAVAELT